MPPAVLRDLANRSRLREYFDEIVEKGDADAIFYTCKTLAELRGTYPPDTHDYKILRQIHQDLKFLSNTNYPKSLLKTQMKTHFENYAGDGLTAILVALGLQEETNEYDRRLETLEKRIAALETRFLEESKNSRGL